MEEKLETATKALRRIAKMLGTFDRDHTKHAQNTIEENQVIAILALQRIGAKPGTFSYLTDQQIKDIADRHDLHLIFEEEIAE